MRIDSVAPKPEPLPPLTYTMILSQDELNILESLVSNTAGGVFHPLIVVMSDELKRFSSMRSLYSVVVDGTVSRVKNTLIFYKES